MALALVLAAPSAHAGSPVTPAARLRGAARRYEAHLLAERPDLGSRYGLERADERLEPVTEATLERDAALLASLRAELDTLAGGASLSVREHATLDTLDARIEREAVPLRTRAWRHEPARYRDLAHTAVLAVATRPHVSPCERTRRAIARLRAVPEVLRAAQVNLRDHLAFDPEREAAAWAAAMFELRTALPALAAGCHDPEREADLIEADSTALAAARRFVRFLRATVPDPPTN